MEVKRKIKTDLGIAWYNTKQKRYLIKYKGSIMPLNIAVYLKVHHKIPKGHEIHHVDGDKFNNHISNLIALSHEDHMKLHNGKRRANYDVEIINNKIRKEDPKVFLTFEVEK